MIAFFKIIQYNTNIKGVAKFSNVAKWQKGEKNDNWGKNNSGSKETRNDKR